MANKNVFITGNSSGLGLAFTDTYLEQGVTVYGLSRRGCPLKHQRLIDTRCDLADLDHLKNELHVLLTDIKQLDLIILNAGILGHIQNLQNTPLREIQPVMDINVWANKVIFDFLLDNAIEVKQIILISSGAAVNGNKGWGAYSLSKATLNMLAMLYAHEMPNTQINTLAPGLIDTAMQDHLCDPDAVDAEQFPSLKKLRNARSTDVMPSPQQAAARLASVFAKLLTTESGSFHDVRTM